MTNGVRAPWISAVPENPDSQTIAGDDPGGLVFTRGLHAVIGR